MSKLQELQQGMPPALKAKHDAMSRGEALAAAKELSDLSMMTHYFGNTCSTRGPDRLAQTSDNLEERARYFRLLAESKRERGHE